MANPEARTNAALKRLGEEFRLGMIPAAEYRARRRQVLESWAERETTTSPGITQRNATRPGDPAAPTPPTRARWMPIAAAAVLLLAAGTGVLLFLKGPSPRASMPAAPPPAARSPAVAVVTATAERLLAEKRWAEADLAFFLDRWRALSSEERRLAWREPAVRSLRHEAQQAIFALEAVAPAAGSAEDAQLQRVLDLVRQLDQQDAP